MFGGDGQVKTRKPNVSDTKPKKCVVRRRRCVTHRVDVVMIKEKKKVFVKNKEGKLVCEPREVESEVCPTV